MTDIRKTESKYTQFCQVANKTQTGTIPATIIGNGDGQAERDLIIDSEFLRKGSIIEIFQHGLLSADNGISGAPQVKINNNTVLTNAATLPNNLINANFESRYVIVVKNITETEITFGIELRSSIVTAQLSASATRQADAETTIATAESYSIDVLYNFGNNSGTITTHMTNITVSY